MRVLTRAHPFFAIALGLAALSPISCAGGTEPAPAPSASQAPSANAIAREKLNKLCEESLRKLPGKPTVADGISQICRESAQIPDCLSNHGTPIFHWERGENVRPKPNEKVDDKALRILVFGLIHGDEPESGSLVRLWSERLTRFMPHNSWRVVPILNPDGWEKHTRTNAHGVDINRNFPTKDFGTHALTHWERDMKKNPRRFPGKEAASEPETKCALAQVEDFKPDFVISVHTPYGLLDLDGPEAGQVKGKFPLPWKRLGTLPGSLGRYLWDERNLPVLTIELKGHEPLQQKQKFEFLQDEMSRVFWATTDGKNPAREAAAKPESQISARDKVGSSSSSPQPR